MKILHLGLLFFISLAALLLLMYLREFFADFLTFFFNGYLNMAGAGGGDGSWYVAQVISTSVMIWLLVMLWKDFGKSRFDTLINTTQD